MKTQNKTQLILNIMNVLFWIVFIGLCIQTGTAIYVFYSMITNGTNEVTYIGSNIFQKLNISLTSFVPIALISIIISLLKTYISYIVIKISTKFDLAQPFTLYTSRLITKISHIALMVGIFQISIHSYYLSLLPEEEVKNSIGNGKGEFLFLAGIIFIIAQIFKRGLELQSENELTI